MTTPFERTLAAIDALHREDPSTTTRPDGTDAPAELVYAERITAWLDRIAPEASEPLQLAVRAQHLCRYRLPRDGYPRTREGYRAWREAAAELAATQACKAALDSGYDHATADRIASLVRKHRLKVDPEAQLLEDVACLVFLANHLSDFRTSSDVDEDKLVQILRKTWRKMGEKGRSAALGLALGDAERALVVRALDDA